MCVIVCEHAWTRLTSVMMHMYLYTCTSWWWDSPRIVKITSRWGKSVIWETALRGSERRSCANRCPSRAEPLKRWGPEPIGVRSPTRLQLTMVSHPSPCFTGNPRHRWSPQVLILGTGVVHLAALISAGSYSKCFSCLGNHEFLVGVPMLIRNKITEKTRFKTMSFLWCTTLFQGWLGTAAPTRSWAEWSIRWLFSYLGFQVRTCFTQWNWKV